MAETPVNAQLAALRFGPLVSAMNSGGKSVLSLILSVGFQNFDVVRYVYLCLDLER
jgi:hypothetical protein